MVDTYNKSLNSDQNSEWNQEYGAFNDAWQKWVDDTSSRAKNEKQSFSNLQTALDKLTPLMSKNKGISQDFVKNSQDSWQKDKKKLGDTSNPDHDDYLAALSPEDFADYKAVLDYYDQYLNKDSQWHNNYKKFSWDNWETSIQAWKKSREKDRAYFHQNVEPQLDNLINLMDQKDDFNDEYEQKYQTKWNELKTTLFNLDTDHVTVSLLNKIDAWKDSIDTYNNYLMDQSKNNTAWYNQYQNFENAWNNWSKEVKAWKEKREIQKENFSVIETC